MYRSPAVLLLDEPTSYLDYEMTKITEKNIKRFAKSNMVIVTTHSDSVASIGDEVIDINDFKTLKSN